MTRLGLTNRILLQWFFIRLTKHIVDKKYWYSIQYWIVPISGWNTDFIYLNKKPKFLQITKKKDI